jgi:starvation-inducible DNA-binding protein
MTTTTKEKRESTTQDGSEPSLATVENSVSEKNLAVLQPVLFDLISLTRVIKQLHWNVIGPNFRPIHLQLDKIYEDVDESVDEVAERMSAVGQSPTGRTEDVLAHTSIKDAPAGFIRDVEVLSCLSDRLKIAAQRIRKRCDEIEDVDTVSADMLHGIIHELEMHHWMIQAQRI